MKKITESELKDKVNSLREYMSVIESAQQEGVMSDVGQWAGNAAGAVSNAYNTAANAVGSGVNAVKQGISDLTTGAQKGYQAATAGTTGQQAAKPAAPQGAKPAAKKGDPGIMKTQQFLKNLGHNIAVDGVWGPDTEAAYKAAFPDAPSNQPAGGTTSAPAAATAPGQTYQQAQGTKQDLSKDMAAATGVANPNVSAPAQAAPAQAAPQGSVFGADGKITGMPAAPAPKKPGVVEFNESDELNRIIQLLK